LHRRPVQGATGADGANRGEAEPPVVVLYG
jgi:hypothetical protein